MSATTPDPTGTPRTAGEPRSVSPPRVTVAIPVYKRLNLLPRALESAAAQDYPELDILVSENGRHAPDELRRLLERHCSRPYRLRSNPESVDICAHFNQLVEAAEGEHFMLLCDDDEIAPECVSRLAAVLASESDVAVALPRLEVLDGAGARVPQERDRQRAPGRMSATEFTRIWCEGEYNFVCFVTNLARTAEIRERGGYPHLARGNSIDNALLVKLILGRRVAHVSDAVFRYRVYEESTGLSVSYQELAEALTKFIDFLATDPYLAEFGGRRPGEWAEVRRLLTEMTWKTYRHRWKNMYRDRLSGPEWVRAAFAMPFIPNYYAGVTQHLVRTGLSASKQLLFGSSKSKAAM